MKEDLHNIDKLFKSSIEEHEEMPSPDVWNSIDKNLDRDKVIDITNRYLTLKKVAIILLVLLAGISFYEITTWKPGTKIVRDATPTETNRNAMPDNQGNKRSKNAAHEKPSSVTKAADSSGWTNSNDSYTKTDGAGRNTSSGGPMPSLNNRHEAGAVTIKDKRPKEDNQHAAILPVPGSDKKIKATNTAGRSIHSNRHIVTRSLYTNNEVVANAQFHGETASTNNKIIPYFTGTVQVTAARSIDTYRNLGSLSSDKLSRVSTEDKSSGNPIKLTAKKRNRFALTGFFSRDFVSNRLIIDGFGNHERDREEIKRTENASSAFTAGLLAEYALSNHWSLQSGLSFSRTTIDIKPKILYARPDNLGNVAFRFNFSAGYSFVSLKTGAPPSTGDSLRAFESKNATQYIGIPLAIKYNFTAGKFRFSVTTGISANILSNQKIKTVISNGRNNERSILNEINGLKNSYFSGLLGMEMDYSISKNIALSLIPNARLALTSINKNAPVKSYPQSFGLGAGIRVQL